MELLRPRNGGPLLLRLLRSMATTRVSLSTATEVSPRVLSLRDSLYNRVVMVVNPRLPVVPVLERWVEEGNAVDKGDLQSMVKKMKTMRRYSHALEVPLLLSMLNFLLISLNGMVCVNVSAYVCGGYHVDYASFIERRSNGIEKG